MAGNLTNLKPQPPNPEPQTPNRRMQVTVVYKTVASNSSSAATVHSTPKPETLILEPNNPESETRNTRPEPRDPKP